MSTSTTISLEVINSNNTMNFYFTVKLSASTEFLISLQGKQLFIQKLRAGRMIPGGTWFNDLEEAVGHYKNKNMKSALEFLPEYISSGSTGEVTI